MSSYTVVKCAMLAMLAVLGLSLLMMPVSASETEIMARAQVAQTFSITVEPSYIDFGMMNIGVNTLDSTWVNSTSNAPYSVKIRDVGAIGGFSGAGFKLLNSGGTPVYQMENKMQARIGTHDFATIETTDTEIYSGEPGTFQNRINYKQLVTINDKPCSGDAKYWTKMVVSGQAI